MFFKIFYKFIIFIIGMFILSCIYAFLDNLAEKKHKFTKWLSSDIVKYTLSTLITLLLIIAIGCLWDLITR